MANLKRNFKFNQKRSVSVGVYDLGFADLATVGSVVATLAPGTVITNVTLLPITAATAASKFSITLGGVAVVTNGDLVAANKATTIISNSIAGGDLVIKNGSTPTAVGTFKFIVEYVEYNKTNGEYTN